MKQSLRLLDYLAGQIAIKCQLEKTTWSIKCISEPLWSNMMLYKYCIKRFVSSFFVFVDIINCLTYDGVIHKELK